MHTVVYNHIEYSEVFLSELGQEMRLDSEYWEAGYLKNETILKSKKYNKIKKIAPNPQYGISIAMNEEGIGYPILKMDNILEILADDRGAKFAKISSSLFKHFELKKYDVLFNRVNSDEYVGRTGIYLLDGKHTFASYLVRINSNNPFTNSYMSIFLNCKYGKTSLQRVKRRAVNQANINAKELGNLTIPIPSLVFQEAIFNLMGSSYKEKLMSEKYYTESERILLTEIGLYNWKPKNISFNLNGVDFTIEKTINILDSSNIDVINRLDSEYYQLSYDEILKIVSSKVKLERLGEMVYLKKGLEVGANAYEEMGKSFIRVSNLSKFGFEFQNQNFISDKLYNKLKDNYEPQKGEILLSKDATPGIAYYLDNYVTGILSSGILRLIFLSEIPPYYLELVINSIFVQKQIERQAGGSVIIHWKPTMVLATLIPRLNSEKEIEINNYVQKAHQKQKLSKFLLEKAIRSVEILIEENEERALEFLKSN